MTADRKDKIYT